MTPLAVALLCGVVTLACGDDTPLAPSVTTVSVSSGLNAVPPGGSATVTARVTEQNGAIVADGTIVRFTATLGRIEPAESPTRGGVATTTFRAGDVAGIAEIRASTATSSPSGQSVMQMAVGGVDATATMAVVDIGGHNVLATAEVRGGTGRQFEWTFEQGVTPTVTAINRAQYTYGSPGHKDISARITLDDGRTLLVSAFVVVN